MRFDGEIYEDEMGEAEESFYDFEKRNGYLDDDDEEEELQDTKKSSKDKALFTAVIIAAVAAVAALIIMPILFLKNGEKE